MRLLASKKLHAITLSVATGSQGELPSEFRLFTSGWNETNKGRFLFDEAAASAVLSDFEARGVDLMIDLEHQSLRMDTPPEPTARDARGWCRLAMRNGELWAVDVKWTPDGVARLTDARQRYVSPAFKIDPESNRIEKLYNIAICAMPATHETPALVAASDGESAMTVEEFLKVIKVLGIDPTSTLDDAIARVKGGGAAADPEDAPPPAGDGGADESTEVAAADPPPPAGAADDKKKEGVAASMVAAARLVALSGTSNLSDAVSEVELWRKSHIELADGKAKLEKDRNALEAGKRAENAQIMIQLGAETPHTSGLAKGKLCKRLTDEPLVEQNARVSALLAARGGKLPTGPKAPTGGGAGSGEGKSFIVNNQTIELSARELQICADSKCEPQTFAMLKARRAPAET